MVDRGRLACYANIAQPIDPTIRIDTPNETAELLCESFTPGPWDVICQGGKESYDHGTSSNNVPRFLSQDGKVLAEFLRTAPLPYHRPASAISVLSLALSTYIRIQLEIVDSVSAFKTT